MSDDLDKILLPELEYFLVIMVPEDLDSPGHLSEEEMETAIGDVVDDLETFASPRRYVPALHQFPAREDMKERVDVSGNVFAHDGTTRWMRVNPDYRVLRTMGVDTKIARPTHFDEKMARVRFRNGCGITLFEKNEPVTQ